MWSELRNLRDGIDLGTPPREGLPVAVTIDGKALEVPAGSSVMAAAAMASCPVPKLCATDTLEAFGSCRVCLVEIQGRKGFPAACTTLVEAGMVVRTESPRLQELRRSVMELYLSDFPAAEIPGGWSELHETMHRLGVDSHPYGTGENHLQAPVDASNPYFVFDPQKCIVCSRCVRACEEIQGTFALTIEGRGFQSKVAASQGESFLASECVSCGACVLACPTHSLVEKSLFPGGQYHAPSTQA